MIASSFAGALAAVIGAIGASIFLIRVDLPLTVLIIVSAGLSALFLYPLTLRAVRAATVSEKALIAFKGEMRTLFQQRYAEKRPQSVPGAMTVAKAYIARRRVVTELVLAIGIGVILSAAAVTIDRTTARLRSTELGTKSWRNIPSWSSAWTWSSSTRGSRSGSWTWRRCDRTTCSDPHATSRS